MDPTSVIVCLHMRLVEQLRFSGRLRIFVLKNRKSSKVGSAPIFCGFNCGSFSLHSGNHHNSCGRNG